MNNENSDRATEQMRVEQEMQIHRQIGFAAGLFQADVTMRTLLEALAQAVVVVDNQGIILHINNQAERMFGYPAVEIIGKPHNTILPERLHNVHEEHIKQYLKEPQARPMGIGLDLIGFRRDGSEFPVEISLSFIQTKNGILVLALVTDITLRKEAEKALKDRAEKLAELNNELESFSYSVSHDLRTPLQTMMEFCKILLEDYAEKLNADGKDYLARISSGANKMNLIISDLLSLSRISRQEMDLQMIDLSALALSIVSELKDAQPARNVEVFIKQNLKTRADPQLIWIALNNLLANALKYTGKTESPRIEFGAYQESGQCVYFVKDNGAGFDMSHSKKLFAPFQRLHSDREFPGIGIGLAIVERVIRRHGGKIWAQGEVGKGATFFFTLS